MHKLNVSPSWMVALRALFILTCWLLKIIAKCSLQSPQVLSVQHFKKNKNSCINNVLCVYIYYLTYFFLYKYFNIIKLYTLLNVPYAILYCHVCFGIILHFTLRGLGNNIDIRCLFLSVCCIVNTMTKKIKYDLKRVIVKSEHLLHIWTCHNYPLLTGWSFYFLMMNMNVYIMINRQSKEIFKQHMRIKSCDHTYLSNCRGKIYPHCKHPIWTSM